MLEFIKNHSTSFMCILCIFICSAVSLIIGSAKVLAKPTPDESKKYSKGELIGYLIGGIIVSVCSFYYFKKLYNKEQ